MAGDREARKWPGAVREGGGSSAPNRSPRASVGSSGTPRDEARIESWLGAQRSLYSSGATKQPILGHSRFSWVCGRFRAVQFHLNQQHAGCRSQPCGFGDHQCQLHEMPVARAILPSHRLAEEKKKKLFLKLIETKPRPHGSYWGNWPRPLSHLHFLPVVSGLIPPSARFDFCTIYLCWIQVWFLWVAGWSSSPCGYSHLMGKLDHFSLRH